MRSHLLEFDHSQWPGCLNCADWRAIIRNHGLTIQGLCPCLVDGIHRPEGMDAFALLYQVFRGWGDVVHNCEIELVFTSSFQLTPLLVKTVRNDQRNSGGKMFASLGESG